MDRDQAWAASLVHQNSVPSVHMHWRMTAILRTIATRAFLEPMRRANRVPHMRELRMDCESGDDQGCERLRHMRALLKDCENGDEEDCERVRRMRALHADCENGDEQDCERLRHMWHEEREDHRSREHIDEHERDRGELPLPADPKIALCGTIENNYNNCVRQQHDGCPAWVIQLKANHCF